MSPLTPIAKGSVVPPLTPIEQGSVVTPLTPIAKGSAASPLTDREGTAVTPLTPIEKGIVVGILIGEGSFGGDGKQPQITLRMHVRHEALFRWLVDRFPRSKLYGPYGHGGRSYYQWMARGTALVEDVLPVLEETLTDDLDAYAAQRLASMRERYADFIARSEARA